MFQQKGDVLWKYPVELCVSLSDSLKGTKMCSELIRASPNLPDAAQSGILCAMQGFGPLGEM